MIDAFRQHAVLPGLIESGLASALARVENLRLRADYTASEIPAAAASLVLEEAGKYVRAVEQAFELQQLAGLQPDEPGAASGSLSSIEERRREAREAWLRMREEENQRSQSSDNDANPNPVEPSRERDRPDEQGHGLGDEPDDD